MSFVRYTNDTEVRIYWPHTTDIEWCFLAMQDLQKIFCYIAKLIVSNEFVLLIKCFRILMLEWSSSIGANGCWNMDRNTHRHISMRRLSPIGSVTIINIIWTTSYSMSDRTCDSDPFASEPICVCVLEMKTRKSRDSSFVLMSKIFLTYDYGRIQTNTQRDIAAFQKSRQFRHNALRYNRTFLFIAANHCIFQTH